MRPIYELCVPRDEVLRGELSEDIFAARLKDVTDGTAEPVYGNPAIFFDNTYPTSGLKTVISDALGRLMGDAAGKNAIIRLETAFGGGKTHNLIALYHILSGHADIQQVTQFINGSNKLPTPDQIKIASVVGSDMDPTLGIHHPEDGLRTYTLWGEIAYQLGESKSYDITQTSDQETRNTLQIGMEIVLFRKGAII